MPGPQQWVVEWVDEGIVRAYQCLCQGVGLLPGTAVHHHLGVFQVQQLLGPFGGGFGYHHGHRHPQLASGVGDCQTGIAT
ncbi:hypothetical protein D9M71_446880 [compost metagenome]